MGSKDGRVAEKVLIDIIGISRFADAQHAIEKGKISVKDLGGLYRSGCGDQEQPFRCGFKRTGVGILFYVRL